MWQVTNLLKDPVLMQPFVFVWQGERQRYGLGNEGRNALERIGKQTDVTHPVRGVDINGSAANVMIVDALSNNGSQPSRGCN